MGGSEGVVLVSNNDDVWGGVEHHAVVQFPVHWHHVQGQRCKMTLVHQCLGNLFRGQMESNIAAAVQVLLNAFFAFILYIL